MEQAKSENEPQILDVSQEFLTMDIFDFSDFCRLHKTEPLSICVDWKNANEAKRVKAFLEGNIGGAKRFATIKCTKDQMMQAPNVFRSGVKWEETPE